MPQRISSFDHYIERSGDLKFEYLNEEESAGNSKSKAFSRDSGREKALPSKIRKSHGKSGENRPLGEWKAVEKRRDAVEVKIRDRTVLTDPPAVYI
jgi:hypothetical protein